MLTQLRRFAVLVALMFWLGGFTFYAAVVVPIGQEELGHEQQGFLTRQVTNYLNISGLVALLPLAWDVAATKDTSPRRRWGRWLAWAAMVFLLAVLFWLHPHLDAFLDLEAR